MLYDSWHLTGALLRQYNSVHLQLGKKGPLMAHYSPEQHLVLITISLIEKAVYIYATYIHSYIHFVKRLFCNLDMSLNDSLSSHGHQGRPLLLPEKEVTSCTFTPSNGDKHQLTSLAGLPQTGRGLLAKASQHCLTCPKH